VYKITVDDHNTSQVREWRWHDVSWPDLSEHPEMQALDEQKQAKIDGRLEGDGDEPEESAADARRSQKIKTAQKARDRGDTLMEAAELVDMSHEWVRQHTKTPVENE